MIYKYNQLLQQLISDFNNTLNLPDNWVPDKKIVSESIKMFMSIDIEKVKPLQKRKKDIFSLAIKKLDLNKSNIKNLIDYIAKFKIYFNYHEKEQISYAFNYNNSNELKKVLLSRIDNIDNIELIMKKFKPVGEEEVFLAIDNMAEKNLNKFLNALFSAYIYNSFSLEDIRKYFTADRYMDKMTYYDYLKYRYTDIFERKCTLAYIDISEELYSRTNLPYSKFRNNILQVLKDYYNKLNNHCYIAISIGAIKVNDISIQWNLYSDIVLYCEKFREVILNTGYFKPEKIQQTTCKYINHLDINSANFKISNEGYTYKDCFVIPQGDSYDILILLQKNEKDERIIPCPECWSDNVQGNSYPTINVRSWECKNPLCSGKSKTNRGKRYSLESLIKQKAITQKENNIPVESLRKWRLDFVDINNKKEIVDMLLLHYSLVGDKVDIISDISIDNVYLKRSINKCSINFNNNIDEVFENFENSAFFKRFMYIKDMHKYKSLNNISDVEGVKVYNMDAYEVLCNIPNESIDGAVTSPPYYNAKEYSSWDNIYCYLYDMYNIIIQVYRILKNDTYFIFNIFDYFDNENSLVFSDMGKKRMILSAYTIYLFRKCGFELQDNIIWFKGEIQGNRNCNQGNNSPYYQAPLNAWEDVFVFKKGNPHNQFNTIMKLKPVFKYKNGVNTLGHDAPYPKEIPELLLKKMQKGNVILDPFSGSMTTGRTAYNYGINSISVDYIEQYCRLGLDLLKEEINIKHD